MSTELERHQPMGVAVPAILTDDEIRRMYRLAEAFAGSAIYKDLGDAKQAFAKMIVGRDLGLTPAESIQGLFFVEGRIQVHYSTLAKFVRGNGYDYRFGTGNPQKIVALGGPADARFWPMEPTNESVTISFWGQLVDGQREWLGDSTFSQADAALAGLATKNNHKQYPRNLNTARAMSNGVRWYVPEATGGMPVYVDGEIPPAPALMAGDSDDVAPQGLDLGPKVDAVIERATTLGHAQLSDRATLEMVLGSRSPDVVNQWVRQATAELDKMEAEQPADAVVVIEAYPYDDDLTQEERRAKLAAEESDPEGLKDDAQRAKRMRSDADELLNEADQAKADGDDDTAVRLVGEAREMLEAAELLTGDVTR